MSTSSWNVMDLVRAGVVALLLGAMAFIAWKFLIAGGDPRPANAPGSQPPAAAPNAPAK